jgi:hypothetical protein
MVISRIRTTRRTEGAYLPDAEETDGEVVREAARKHLADDEDIAGECGLEHDRHVARVEELDGVAPAEAARAVALDWDLDSEALEVDDDGEHKHSRDEVHDVGEAVTPERLAECTALVVPREEEVEERDERALKLGPAAGVDGRRRESLPDDRLADVCGDEEGDAGAEAVALLKEFIEEDHNESGDDELDDKKKAHACTEVAGLAVEAGKDVDSGLAESDGEGEDCDDAVNSDVRITGSEADSRFWAPLKSARSSLSEKSTSMRLAPARSCMIIPDVTMGEMPSSMSVPRFDARITRIQ